MVDFVGAFELLLLLVAVGVRRLDFVIFLAAQNGQNDLCGVEQ